uniref:Uncharacterized protein n=1 Tax=Arundo donax TaxID=35708 RepID=A0A0A9HP44_ARUDO
MSITHILHINVGTRQHCMITTYSSFSYCEKSVLYLASSSIHDLSMLLYLGYQAAADLGNVGGAAAV